MMLRRKNSGTTVMIQIILIPIPTSVDQKIIFFYSPYAWSKKPGGCIIVVLKLFWMYRFTE